MMKTIPALALSAFLLLSCAGPQERPDLPPDVLYAEARQAVEDGRYEEAQELLDRVRDEFPFSSFAAEAELLGADMRFEEEKYEEAAAAYRSFEELHPTHPKVPYALFRRGEAYLEMSLPADRDQTATRNAAEAFQKLLYAYPRDEHAAQAREHLVLVRNRLADHELYVARYYVRRKQYGAALQRLQTLVAKYPDTPQQDEAKALAEEAGRLQASAGEKQGKE